MRTLLLIGTIMCALPAAAFQESPKLAQRVAAGELPPVAQRLPEQPAVVEPVESIGKYGGYWRRLVVGNKEFHLIARLGYEPLLRWGRDARGVVPNLAERWEIRDDGRTFVLFLRKGVRWSDGVPFTSDDLMFWYEDIAKNKEITPAFPSWLMNDSEPVTMRAPDAYTIEYHFSKPYGLFLEYLAFMSNTTIFPKHYLSQFHPKYTDPDTLAKRVKERGLAFWYQLMGQKLIYDENPELPSLKPFVLSTDPTGSRVVAERNAYYWKVDPAGNQLPYLDGIAYTVVQNNEILNFKTMAGDADFQDRHVDTANFPLFMENRVKGHYRVLRDGNPTPFVIYLNQCSQDAEWRTILQNRKFRIALSIAINRKELIDIIFSGMAAPTRGVASPYDPYYLPEFDEKYLEYDPELANEMLDDLGFTRDSSGMRRMPGGKPFRQILNVYPSEVGFGLDMYQLIADYWQEVGLSFVVKTDAPTLSSMQARNGNSDFWAYATSGMLWIVDPQWYVPWADTSYFAPLFGRYYMTHGKGGVKPPPEYQRLLDWYLELRSTVNDEDRRRTLAQNILRQWSDECYTIGICSSELLAIVSNRFRNVPEHLVHDYRAMTPGYIGIEQFYIDEG